MDDTTAVVGKPTPSMADKKSDRSFLQRVISATTRRSSTEKVAASPNDQGDVKPLVVTQNSVPMFYDSAGPPPEKLGVLDKAALVPRVHSGPTFPFARAWVPELAKRGVKQEEWLGFLDHVNLISFPHPSVTIIEMAAIGVGYVPVDGAEGLSSLVDLIGDATARAIAKERCRRFLLVANEAYFHPRKLHARIVNTKAMKRALGIQKGDPLIAPLSEDMLKVSAQDRCLAMMKTYSAELDFESVPEPAATGMPAKVLERVQNWRTRGKVRKRDRAARWSRKRAWKKIQKGKKVKREGWGERHELKWMDWLLVQDREEFEKQEAEIALEKARKKAEKKSWRRKAVEADGQVPGQQEEGVAPIQDAKLVKDKEDGLKEGENTLIVAVK